MYEALRPILNEMSQRIEQFDMRLSALDESLRDDFSGVERELNSTANMIYDKIENEITSQWRRKLLNFGGALSESSAWL